jgi:hypothetical protein
MHSPSQKPKLQLHTFSELLALLTEWADFHHFQELSTLLSQDAVTKDWSRKHTDHRVEYEDTASDTTKQACDEFLDTSTTAPRRIAILGDKQLASVLGRDECKAAAEAIRVAHVLEPVANDREIPDVAESLARFGATYQARMSSENARVIGNSLFGQEKYTTDGETRALLDKSKAVYANFCRDVVETRRLSGTFPRLDTLVSENEWLQTKLNAAATAATATHQRGVAKRMAKESAGAPAKRQRWSEDEARALNNLLELDGHDRTDFAGLAEKLTAKGIRRTAEQVRLKLRSMRAAGT